MAKKKAAKKVVSGAGRGKRISPEMFVTAFKAVRDKGGTAQDLADRLGRPKSFVNQRIASYRKAGVKLTGLKKGRRQTVNVDALNKILDSKI